MIIAMECLLSIKSFLLSYYNKKENDKGGFWIWNISGILWGINAVGEIIKMICQ